MSYDIVLSQTFKNSVKKMQKRFLRVKDDVKSAIGVLKENPQSGDLISGGHGIRKLRIKNTYLDKGKSGGYRLIYCFEDKPVKRIYMLFLYAKSDKDDVTKKELTDLLDELSKIH